MTKRRWCDICKDFTNYTYLNDDYICLEHESDEELMRRTEERNPDDR